MRLLLLSIALIMMLPALAQTEFSMYRLNGNLAQANMLNPAFAPNSKIVIGLPVVSSLYLSLDNDGIAFRDIFRTSETDSLAMDTVSILGKLKDSHHLKFKEEIQLFYLGLRGKRSYFSFAIHQVSETRFNYPGDLIGWAIRGPGSSHYAGKPLNFNNFYGKSIAYSKISLNYSRDITPRLRIGARYNYLIGIAAGETKRINGSLTMGIDSVTISTGDLQVQTAGIDFFDQDDLTTDDYKNYFLKSKNKGMGIDLGATYDLTDQLTLSASVNDLGYINWKDYTRSYQVAPINYTFRGFDLLDYLNKSPGDEFLQAELDSLENLYNATETTGGKFKTSLTGKLYAGINFKVLKVHNFSALLYFDMVQKKIDPAISLGYNLQLGRFLNTTVGITYQNGKINNIGAGLALKLTHLQFYLTSDRANSFVYPARAGRADAHLGMNIVFGRANKKDKVKKEEEAKEEPPVEEEKQDTVATEAPVIQPIPEDTTQRTPAATVAPLETQQETKEEAPVDTVSAKEEPVIVNQEPKYEVVKQGSHEDELLVSHYVVVGAFRSRENAKRYSDQLKREGFENSYGFVSDKNVYHVYVHTSTDLEETRRIRDEYRKRSEFQFASSWVLTVEK